MLGAAIHDKAVDRSGAITMQERKVGPVGLGQLVIKEGGVPHAVQLILLFQEAIPNAVPFRQEAADRLERAVTHAGVGAPHGVRHGTLEAIRDRKSTRLNSSHQIISYAVF